jgi:hypothetical protein
MSCWAVYHILSLLALRIRDWAGHLHFVRFLFFFSPGPQTEVEPSFIANAKPPNMRSLVLGFGSSFFGVAGMNRSVVDDPLT